MFLHTQGQLTKKMGIWVLHLLMQYAIAVCPMFAFPKNLVSLA